MREEETYELRLKDWIEIGLKTEVKDSFLGRGSSECRHTGEGEIMVYLRNSSL